MGVTYQRLAASPGSRAPPRARAWALLRWAAVRLSCAARRRWCMRARRLSWAGICVGRAGGGAPAEKRKGRSSAAVAGYDSVSYARNFDDGAWKAEEGLSWAPVARVSVSDVAMAATGDPVVRSSTA
ncbi:hypothetical protein QOZ80_8AG0636780 [Eleusine coracana subsp. coracana]|nr:hypothetical protein QOZ80_8AG0636780 [Eleusine coracana subsp. coracana]